jgi:hypothetical protein
MFYKMERLALYLEKLPLSEGAIYVSCPTSLQDCYHTKVMPVFLSGLRALVPQQNGMDSKRILVGAATRVTALREQLKVRSQLLKPDNLQNFNYLLNCARLTDSLQPDSCYSATAVVESVREEIQDILNDVNVLAKLAAVKQCRVSSLEIAKSNDDEKKEDAEPKLPEIKSHRLARLINTLLYKDASVEIDLAELVEASNSSDQEIVTYFQDAYRSTQVVASEAIPILEMLREHSDRQRLLRAGQIFIMSHTILTIVESEIGKLNELIRHYDTLQTMSGIEFSGLSDKLIEFRDICQAALVEILGGCVLCGAAVEKRPCTEHIVCGNCLVPCEGSAQCPLCVLENGNLPLIIDLPYQTANIVNYTHL